MSYFCRNAILSIPILLCACATSEIEDSEQMLAAAGFAMEPATTPELVAQLQALPPHRLLMQAPAASGTPPSYVYADPDRCHCLYIGGPSNYQYFQQLAVQRRIADEQMMAAMMNQNAALNWSMFPPPPVVIVHGHGHH
jgi:hypothetical protein